MKPSDTEGGVAWLANFAVADQPTAQLLLDSLELVGADVLWNGLRDLLQRLGQTLASPLSLVPVRELAPEQAYFAANKNASPRLLHSGSLPGSEGTVATLLNSLRRLDENNGPFTAAPSLPNMRASRTNSVVLVDDFAGSGDRILKFKRGFHRHPTLRSWRSRKLFDYRVAVYAATRGAAERLTRRFGEGFVHVHRIAPSFGSRNWTLKEVRAVKDLCRRYKLPGLATHPYGHGAAEGLLAFAHTAPNNLPPILWQLHGPTASGAPWVPFFQDKAVPTELAVLFGARSDGERDVEALKRFASSGRWSSVEPNFAPPVWRRLLLVLVAIDRRPRTQLRLAELTDMPLAEALSLVVKARECGLVSQEGLHLTDSGRAELRHGRAMLRLPEDDERALKGSDEPYYPTSLRVGR